MKIETENNYSLVTFLFEELKNNWGFMHDFTNTKKCLLRIRAQKVLLTDLVKTRESCRLTKILQRKSVHQMTMENRSRNYKVNNKNIQTPNT